MARRRPVVQAVPRPWAPRHSAARRGRRLAPDWRAPPAVCQRRASAELAGLVQVLPESWRRSAVLPGPARFSREARWPGRWLAASAVWERWAEPRRRAGPDAPALPPVAAVAEQAVAVEHAGAPPRVAPGEPGARRQAVRAGTAVLLPAEPAGTAVLLVAEPAVGAALRRAAPAEVAVLRQAEPGEAAVLLAGAVARLREVGPAAEARRQVVQAAAAALPWEAAWVFRRDRRRLAVRRRSAPSARAMRSLRTASPQQPSWPAARDEVLS